ncbi:MAG: hypothetical protein AB7U92_09880 [Piscinibacter sp.]|uniref:hypothetical protein n=1 Tax=Piscinibacter sp. TaxID=1903157 RepID=UPI003D0D8581
MGIDATSLQAWLAAEIDAVEASLAGQGASCSLDRRREAPPRLKHDEGRYAALRLARRSLERGDPRQELREAADKARAFLAGDSPLLRDRAWVAYQQGLLEALEQALRHTGGHDETPSARRPG